jgi:hypothetical protein
VLAEVVEVVVMVQQVARRYFSEVVGGIVVVAVDRKYRNSHSVLVDLDVDGQGLPVQGGMDAWLSASFACFFYSS